VTDTSAYFTYDRVAVRVALRASFGFTHRVPRVANSVCLPLVGVAAFFGQLNALPLRHWSHGMAVRNGDFLR